MAQYSIPNSDGYLECPYNKTHLVEPLGFQNHLMRCRNNHKGRKYARCPFNAQHEMPKPKYRHHLQHCPDKALIELELQYRKLQNDHLIKQLVIMTIMEGILSSR